MSDELKAVVLKAMNSEAFAEELARRIGDVAEAKILDEFYNDVNRKLDERAKKVVDYYIEHYKQADIQRLVDKALGSLTKKEILERLS